MAGVASTALIVQVPSGLSVPLVLIAKGVPTLKLPLAPLRLTNGVALPSVTVFPVIESALMSEMVMPFTLKPPTMLLLAVYAPASVGKISSVVAELPGMVSQFAG